ncbi:MAG: hypothetical protein ACR2QM_20920 [Longimicrobiales bacterium]
MTAGILEHDGMQVVQSPTAQGDEDWEQDAWEKDEAPEWAEEEDWEDDEDDDDDEDDSGKDSEGD